jgi:putative ABC transport system permease protein
MKQDWIDELTARLSPLRLRPEREAEIVDEMAQHLDDQVRELIASGAEPDAATRHALADLDTPGVLARRLAEIEAPSPYALPPPGAPSRGRWFGARWLDVRHSIRALRRTPAFTAAVIVTMALTIGPTTAMLSIGNWLLWRPVPAVSDANRLAVVYFGRWLEDGRGVSPNRVSPLNIADLVAGSRTIQAMAGTQEGSDSVTIEGRLAENTGVAHADANLFAILGVRPSAGRYFTADEDVLPYGTPVAVVSDGLARRAFGTPQGAIGKTILLNGRRLAVIGVAPKGFRGITPFSLVDVWYPGAAYRYLHHFSSISPTVTRRDGTFYSFVVRLSPGAKFEAAKAELDVLVSGLAERHPEENRQFQTVQARLFPGLGPNVLQRGTYRTMVWRLLSIGAVLVVLGCANVVNLLIFRGVRREREHAVRMALGAGRARLLQLQLTESCLLTVAGAALGVGLASAMTRLILTLVLPGAATSDVELTVPIDARVLFATLAISVGCGLAAGFLPAWMSVSRPVSVGLSQAGVRGTPRGRRLRAGFAVVQLALSLALLVGAMLMVTTVRGLSSVDPGFEADGVSVHYVDLASQGYTPPRALQYVRDLEAGLSSTPGVTAAFSYSYPLASAFTQNLQAPDAGQDPIEVRTNSVSTHYFSALGIPLVTGRAFTAQEAMAPGENSGNAIVIGRSLARRLFGASDPLGRTVTVPGARSVGARTLVVVGVAEDVRTDLVTGEPELSLYEPFARTSVFVLRPTVLVKSELTIRAASETVRAVAARIDPTVPISGNQPLRAQTIDRRLASQRVFAWVLSLLGALGFVLAAVGLYGLLAQAVTERTREFGIRMAIGATRAQIYSLVLRYAALIAVIGSVAGLGLALVGSRVIEAQLWGVTARDPSTYATAALALLGVVFVAAAWPARLATRVEPVEALRSD